MRCFLYVSLCFLLAACSRHAYKDQEEITLSQSYTADDLKPSFNRELYRCAVDGKFALKKFHLSGILYFRNLSDTATRVVFQSEMGSTFFDFGWDRNDSFTVYSIIGQMDKPALIKTLRKDFELLLARNIDPVPSGVYRFYKDARANYVRFELGKGFVHYITNMERKVTGIENADERQKVVVMEYGDPTPLQQLPEQLSIRHLKAGFTIDLKKISKDDTAE